MSSTAIIIVWFNKTAISDATIQALQKEAKQADLNLLPNKDKNTHGRAIASTLMKQKEDIIPESVDLHKTSTDDVQITSI